MNKIEYYSDEFSWLDDDDRLTYLIDLAKKATTLPQELRTEERLVPGCMSKIWIDVGLQESTVQVYYDSDAMITKGITSVICDCFSDMDVNEAKQLKKEDFESLGIKELLTSQRRNGLSNLISIIIEKVNNL